MTYGSGSKGYTSVARVKAVIDEFYFRPIESQTSAVFASIWSSRATVHLDVELPYIIGGGEDTETAAGWIQYIRRLHRSSGNTSTASNSGVLDLPSPVWTQFGTDRVTLAAISTHEHGTTDADHGRRVYEFLVSAAINSDKYKRGQYRELLEAWGAAGSSSLPTT